jgi:uncharacterized membrane protein
VTTPKDSSLVDGAESADDRPAVIAGELPSAETIEAYEHVLPGAADRILAMLEHQSEHRMTMERTVVQAAARSERLGQLLGLGLVLVVFLTATRLITSHHEIPGTLLAVADLGLLVAVFLGRDRSTG